MGFAMRLFRCQLDALTSMPQAVASGQKEPQTLTQSGRSRQQHLSSAIGALQASCISEDASEAQLRRSLLQEEAAARTETASEASAFSQVSYCVPSVPHTAAAAEPEAACELTAADGCQVRRSPAPDWPGLLGLPSHEDDDSSASWAPILWRVGERRHAALLVPLKVGQCLMLPMQRSSPILALCREDPQMMHVKRQSGCFSASAAPALVMLPHVALCGQRTLPHRRNALIHGDACVGHGYPRTERSRSVHGSGPRAGHRGGRPGGARRARQRGGRGGLLRGHNGRAGASVERG